MARLPRLVIGGLPHVVSLQVQHSQALAHDDTDRSTLLERLRASAQEQVVAVHAYAIGDDGIDLLVSPTDAPALGRFVQSLARRHASAFNRRHGRHGSLWAGRYRTAALEPDAWMLRCMRWVELRAQRVASLHAEAASAADWSSLAHHAGRSVERWIVDPPAYWVLGNTPFERELAYRAWLQTALDTGESGRIESALRGGWFLGDEAYLRKLVPEPSRPVAPRSPGRPAIEQINMSPK